MAFPGLRIPWLGPAGICPLGYGELLLNAIAVCGNSSSPREAAGKVTPASKAVWDIDERRESHARVGSFHAARCGGRAEVAKRLFTIVPSAAEGSPGRSRLMDTATRITVRPYFVPVRLSQRRDQAEARALTPVLAGVAALPSPPKHQMQALR